MRMITLRSKCYYADNCSSPYGQDAMLKPKFSCKGVSKKQSPLSWARYLEALNGCIDKAQNMGFQILGKGTVMNTQEKLGLSTYSGK